MGLCSSNLTELGLFTDQGEDHNYPGQPQSSASAMSEPSAKTDFTSFLEANNAMVQLAKNKFQQFDELRRDYHDLKRRYQDITAENDSLRQRIGDNSEMSHRSHQSNSEDARSRNKRSEVLHKYKAIDGATRRQAMETFRKQTSIASRADLWNRKDLTCRIFVIAYRIAEDTKKKFIQEALPRFLQCAPSVGFCFGQNHSEVPNFSQQDVAEEMQSLISTESFKVASFSILKEMAVTCDLTDLEKEMMRKLTSLRDQWKKKYPSLPYLEDTILNHVRMKNYIKECLRIAWRMVNLLPPLKVVTPDEVCEKAFDEFFDKEIDANKENADTMIVCVWPAVIDGDNLNEVIVKGTVAIIPRQKNLSYAVQAGHA